MISKSDIIKEVFPLEEDDHIELPNGADLNWIIEEVLPPKFDEFAKWQSIEFAEWANKNRWYLFENGKWHYAFHHGTYMSRAALEKDYQKTTEQLYELFLESKTAKV